MGKFVWEQRKFWTHLILKIHSGIQNLVNGVSIAKKGVVTCQVTPNIQNWGRYDILHPYRVGVSMAKKTTQSEPDGECIPFGESSPLAKVEGLPLWWFSSLPLDRGLPNLDRIWVPMGNGSCKEKNIVLATIKKKKGETISYWKAKTLNNTENSPEKSILFHKFLCTKVWLATTTYLKLVVQREKITSRKILITKHQSSQQLQPSLYS